MDKNTIEEFNKVFEEEYIIARVKLIYDCLENNNYEQAIDILNMIQGKAVAAVAFIYNNK